MKILVISDNQKVASFVVKHLSGDPRDAGVSVDLCYSARSRNPQQMLALGASGIDLRDDSVLEHILTSYDLVVSAHCKQIFPPKMVNGVRCVNLHPGLNPYNRGWYPQVFSILNGHPHGATLHEMDEEIDHGAVIDQMEVEVLPWDTSYDVYERVIDAEELILARSVPILLSGQKLTGSSAGEGNYNSIRDFEALCELDYDNVGTLREHIALLRALSHPPYWNARVTERGRHVWFRLEVRAETRAHSD